MWKTWFRAAVFFLGLAVITVLAVPAGATVSSKRIGVDVNPNGGIPDTSDITVEWAYTPGDVLEKSVDGLSWTVVPPSVEGLAVVEAVPNWSILYFRLNEGGGGISRFTAYPPNLNAHDTYSRNTSMCAGCHSTHAAEGRKLMKGASQKELCRICHGYLNTGSRYNTDNGAVIAAGNKNPVTGVVTDIVWVKSLAGPFETNDLEVWGAGKVVTSAHNVELPAQPHPPGGQGRSTADGNCNRCHGFTCSSCHVVHGGAGTYRQLDPIYGTITAYAYNPTGNQAEKARYDSGMAQFCGFCHDLLLKPEDSGHVLTGTRKPLHGFIGTYPENRYRHATGVDLTYTLPGADPVIVVPTVLPTEGNPKTVSCITCHYAHGTVADVSFNTNFPTDSLGHPMGTNGSMLLRDGTGRLCQDCHRKE